MTEEAFETWLETIASGKATMSQRNVRWVEANGRLPRLVEAAKARDVHLVQLTDDKGKEVLAASTKPFTTLALVKLPWQTAVRSP